MRTFNILGFLLVAASLFACSSAGGVKTFPLKRTDTAVVRIFLDEQNMPRVIEETVVVEPGQRVVWVGPKDFTIRFPNGSPFKIDSNNALLKEPVTFSTTNSVFVAQVPKPKPKQQFLKDGEKSTSFKYDVIVNGRVLDPEVIVVW